MKAIIWTQYGSPDTLQLRDVKTPVPQDNEVLIKIHATTVTMGDCEIRSLNVLPFLWLPMRLWLGVTKPKKNILGQEFAGEIEAVGKDVTRFKPGDQVVGSTGMHLGAYAEYTCLPENSAITFKPQDSTYEEAAALPLGGLVSLQFLRKARIQPGQKVLINGAGGSIGTLGIQIARAYGAVVTAVDSTAKLDVLRALGADQVVDYTQDDFSKQGETYDVIFDVAGKGSLTRGLRCLAPNGVYLLANPGSVEILQGLWATRVQGKHIVFGAQVDSADDLDQIRTLVEDGKITPVIDRCYPLEQMQEAHRYVEQGLKIGNVVITVQTH